MRKREGIRNKEREIRKSGEREIIIIKRVGKDRVTSGRSKREEKECGTKVKRDFFLR